MLLWRLVSSAFSDDDRIVPMQVSRAIGARYGLGSDFVPTMPLLVVRVEAAMEPIPWSARPHPHERAAMANGIQSESLLWLLTLWIDFYLPVFHTYHIGCANGSGTSARSNGRSLKREVNHGDAFATAQMALMGGDFAGLDQQGGRR
jgi:hypothetical protein